MSFFPTFDNLQALAEHSFAQYPDNNFLQAIDGEGLTYQQAQHKVVQLQTMFGELGIKHGDKVAICSENMPNWGIVYLAATTMGIIAVPILADFHVNEIHHIITHCEAKVLFVSKRIANKLGEDDYTSKLEYVFSLEKFELIEDLSNEHSELFIKGAKTFAQFKNKALQFAKEKHLIKEQALADKGKVKSADIAVIIYTSGTTGQSKGVMLTHYNLASQVTQAHSFAEIIETDRFLSILPLAHTYECSIGFLVPLSVGASVHYINRVPSPKIILSSMQVVKPTCMLSVPLIIEKIYKSKVLAKFNSNFLVKHLYHHVPFIRKKLHKVAGKKLKESFGGEMKFFGIGGAKLSSFVERFLIEAEFPYSIGYGLTETAPVIAGASVGATKVGTTGLLAPGVEYRLVRKDSNDKDGELHVRGPNIMLGYYKDKVRTAEVLDEEGWLNTGDLGNFDENAVLTINGRSKNVIIGASGENIYPESVEAVINQHPLVLDSMVYELEEQLVAKIHIDYDLFDQQHNLKKSSEYELHKDVLSTLNEIKDISNQQLAAFSRLKAVFEQSEPFVKTPTKKIKRYLYT